MHQKIHFASLKMTWFSNENVRVTVFNIIFFPFSTQFKSSSMDEDSNGKFSIERVNPYTAELFASIFRHLKLELLTQFPASNNEKNIYI